MTEKSKKKDLYKALEKIKVLEKEFNKALEVMAKISFIETNQDTCTPLATNYMIDDLGFGKDFKYSLDKTYTFIDGVLKEKVNRENES